MLVPLAKPVHAAAAGAVEAGETGHGKLCSVRHSCSLVSSTQAFQPLSSILIVFNSGRYYSCGRRSIEPGPRAGRIIRPHFGPDGISTWQCRLLIFVGPSSSSAQNSPHLPDLPSPREPQHDHIRATETAVVDVPPHTSHNPATGLRTGSPSPVMSSNGRPTSNLGSYVFAHGPIDVV